MSTAEAERNIFNHYNLTNAYPIEWPRELDESDEDDLDRRTGIRRSKSRYSALERNASNRMTLLPGSQKTNDGKTNLVQKDEPDPLGGGGSVISSIKHRGLPVEHDLRLRNKFLLSSTTFSPALFLSQAHSDASADDLLSGLQYLSQSIDQKAQSLKVLVESNFERFVRAKATIDNVYSEMRNQGMPQQAPPSPNRGRHSRQTSRQSGIHSRQVSMTAGTPANMPPSKNALRKEMEYGVLGIKGPLLEVAQRAEDVWGPALGGKERETSLKAIIDAVEKDHDLYELGGNLGVAIRQKDYEKAVSLYGNARSYATQAAALSERAVGGQPLTDQQIHKILVCGRMWGDVEEQIKSFRRDIWRTLTRSTTHVQATRLSQMDEDMELIGILLELGVEDNPIWVWLLSRYDSLKNKITAVVGRSKVEIEVLRRRLAVSEAATPANSATYLRQATNSVVEDMDSDQVIEFWKTLLAYVTKLVSLRNGLFGEVLDFWESAQSFIEGNKQKALPTGFEGESRKHHRLSDNGIIDLRNGVIDLVNLIRDALYSVFAEEPSEDISALFSPLTGSAMSPNLPFNTTFSPSDGRVGNIDEHSVPDLSASKDGSGTFAFWAPHSNSLSAVHYLGRILMLVGTASSEMAALKPVANDSNTYEKIKTMVAATRERCLRAVCEAWAKDGEHCRYLEDWLRSPEHRNLTRLPTYFLAMEKHVLSGMQQVLYFSDSITKPSAREILPLPTQSLMQMVRSHFTSSIFKALGGMLENAETAPKSDENEWTALAQGMQDVSMDETIVEAASVSVDARDRSVRMLLTLSNLKSLRNDIVPQLIQQFETSFSVKLTDESKSIKDVFNQTDVKLFQSYTKPSVSYLTKTIKNGINSRTWVPNTTRPDQVSSYVYAALMYLVMIHTEVSTTVAVTNSSSSSGTSTGTGASSQHQAALLTEVLSHLLESVSQALLDGFKDRKPNTYTLSALIQATLDTEFIAQTMSQYASAKAGEIQNQIYVELDKRTTNDARADLQKELGEMRIVLKRLREGSRNSFGCFKKVRGGGDKERGRS